jgi:hypothetical protein
MNRSAIKTPILLMATFDAFKTNVGTLDHGRAALNTHECRNYRKLVHDDHRAGHVNQIFIAPLGHKPHPGPKPN